MKAVVTMCFGQKYEELSVITQPTLKKYAEKIGADFVVINEKRLSNKYIHYEKFQIFDLFGKYHRILFLDSDIIVRPDCPDLFEVVSENKLGIFDEGRFEDFLPVIRDACVKYKMSIPKWSGQSYNTGVMVLSRLHKHLFKKPDQEYDCYNGYLHYEQPYINLKIMTENVAVKDIGYKFNRISIMDKPTGENRLSSYMIHYAGAPESVRLNLIKDDLKSWEESGPDYNYKKNIHITIGGGLGDQVDAEPVVRYISEKMYIGDNIRIKTDFPRIFKHLPVKIASDMGIKKDTTVYYPMETLPSPEAPLWKYMAQTLCHTTDFASISAIRRILSDNEKQIKIEVGFEDITALVSSIGIHKFGDMVLVHPGKGWQSKTFPSEYWQGIIDGLVEIGLPVAVIGKYISDEQGLVDVKCPEGSLDLRNLLSLNELITLISQARVLVSNDSAPVHIAGAFDNWIVLIPTCKHPDHILPYRRGTKAYKTLALYKKLTSEAIDSSPTQVDGQTIDYVVGGIMEYLPDVSTVVENVNNIYSEKKS